MKKKQRPVMSGAQIGLSVLSGFLAVVLIVMIFVTAYANHYLGQLNYIPDDTTLSSDAIESIEADLTETMPSDYTGPTMEPTIVTQPEDDEPPVIIQHKNLINFLLVGQDRRPGEGRQRSDSMIVVSVNTKDKTITLTSFMRDMYVYIPGYKANKMNAAYARGGFPMLCETLMTNFGMAIDGCVEVDFEGFTSVIDLVGGVDINLTAKEVKYLNDGYGWNLKVGMNHLNGAQALGYSRDRANGNDYARTERQRTVLMEVFKKCKNMSLVELQGMLNQVLPLISTNMTKKEITNYLIDLFPMISGAQMNTLRIPANGTYKSAFISGAGSCLVPDLEKNRDLLAETLLPK
jgi:LCP family protein required for cell wall assembly